MSAGCRCLKRFIKLEKKRGKDAQHRFSNYSRDKRLLLKSNSCFGEVCLLTDETIVPAGGDAGVKSLGPISPCF